MIITVHLESDTPLYQQIRSQIVAGIASGELAPSEQLPSVRSLAEELGINLHTVNKAYSQLQKEGYVVIKGRAGVRVLDPGESGSVNRRRKALASIAQQLQESAHEAKAWGISEAEFSEQAQEAYRAITEKGETR